MRKFLWRLREALMTSDGDDDGAGDGVAGIVALFTRY
jgi:hypothetical protein